MPRAATASIITALLLSLTACQTSDSSMPGDRNDTRPYGDIALTETLHFTGTEPFWGGEVNADAMLYRTAEMQEGQKVAASRFAGRGGVSWSGTLDGKTFTLAATPGDCTDGMSNRTYPFVVTLQIGDDMRSGCGWSVEHPFTGPPAP